MKVLHVGWGFRPWRSGGLIEYAEDLMNIQVAQGYEVAYFFSGCHYPLFRKPRLRKWLREDIKMYEIINSPIHHAGDQGTVRPEVDLNEEYSEKFFKKVLAKFKPDIIHIQELAGLPSSLIEIAELENIPLIMTLHDYYLFCPTLKLFDYNYSICLKSYVGNNCLVCCAQAPPNANHLIKSSLIFEANKRWFLKSVPNSFKVKAKKLVKQVKQLLRYLGDESLDQNSQYNLEQMDKLAEVFQNRRDVNVERLNKIDLLVAQSFRVNEIYRTLGVKGKKIVTIHSTVKHIDKVKSKTMASIIHPINFVTLNSCASAQKGVHLILGALHKLKQMGISSHFKLFVMGHVLDSAKYELLQFDNVVYKGIYNVADLDSLLQGMHVGIVPSAWEEVYGYVGIEFLAKGIPVIGNSLGGIVDYTVDNVTGWVNSANTADGLAQIMADIIYNPYQILDLNRSIISNYHQIIKSMDRHSEEMDKVYKELIQAKQNQELGVI